MNRVKELRKRAGLLQKDVADAAGTTRITVSEWENQKKDPSGERLMRLAHFFGVTTGVVLCYEPVPSPVPVLFVDDGSPQVDDEIIAARERVRRDPERGILFSMATNADIADVRRAIAIIKALESEEVQGVATASSESSTDSPQPSMGQQ